MHSCLISTRDIGDYNLDFSECMSEKSCAFPSPRTIARIQEQGTETSGFWLRHKEDWVITCDRKKT